VAVQQEGAQQQPITTNQPPPDAGEEFSQALEQQISRAIQPALEDFRRQMAQTLEREVERMPGVAPSAPDNRATEPLTAAAEDTTNNAAATAQSGTALLGQVAQRAQTAVTETASQSVGKLQQQLTGITDTVQPAVNNTIRPALERVERQGEEWATSLLVAALTALLTESSRRFIEQRAESGLQALTQKLFEAAPQGVTTPDMPAKVEAALMAIVRDTLDALFAEGMRASVQHGGQVAIQQSFHGDFGAAVNGVEEIAKRMGETLVTALRQQWPTVLRLALALALLALDSALTESGRKGNAKGAGHAIPASQSKTIEKTTSSATNGAADTEKTTNKDEHTPEGKAEDKAQDKAVGKAEDKAVDKPESKAESKAVDKSESKAESKSEDKPAEQTTEKAESKAPSRSASGGKSATKNGGHTGNGSSSASKSSGSRARSTSRAKDTKS